MNHFQWIIENTQPVVFMPALVLIWLRLRLWLEVLLDLAGIKAITVSGLVAPAQGNLQHTFYLTLLSAADKNTTGQLRGGIQRGTA